MKMICENCAFSIEVKPYNDPECPYMICASGEVVSRWQNCDDWKSKEHDRRTEELDPGSMAGLSGYRTQKSISSIG